MTREELEAIRQRDTDTWTVMTEEQAKRYAAQGNGHMAALCDRRALLVEIERLTAPESAKHRCSHCGVPKKGAASACSHRDNPLYKDNKRLRDSLDVLRKAYDVLRDRLLPAQQKDPT